MDAFYASVELLRYPQLRGSPVVIGGRRRAATGAAICTLRDYTGRGVITTATYEARAFGLHSGMGLMKAAQLAPDAVLLPADFDEYRRYSRMFKDAVRAVAPEIEERGRGCAGPVGPRTSHRDRPPARGTRGDGAWLFDRHHAEQAAFEDRLRA